MSTTEAEGLPGRFETSDIIESPIDRVREATNILREAKGRVDDAEAAIKDYRSMCGEIQNTLAMHHTATASLTKYAPLVKHWLAGGGAGGALLALSEGGGFTGIVDWLKASLGAG